MCAQDLFCLVLVNQRLYFHIVSLLYQFPYCPMHRWQFLLIMWSNVLGTYMLLDCAYIAVLRVGFLC